MKTICFPKGLKVIGMNAFHFCGMEKLELPDTLETIDPDFIGEELINKSTRIRCYQGSKVDAYCQEHDYITEYIE